jgi:hypothetical protein
LRQLDERIGDRNNDLADAQIDELADRFSREFVEDLVADGKSCSKLDL